MAFPELLGARLAPLSQLACGDAERALAAALAAPGARGRPAPDDTLDLAPALRRVALRGLLPAAAAYALQVACAPGHEAPSKLQQIHD